jgi:hypothetical protein
MIEAAKIKEAERLLAEGVWSQRKIAKMVGISRAVVGSIAAGTRPDYDARRQARHEEEHEPLGPVGRCPGCGMMMHMPCRLCKVRELKAMDREIARAARRREQAASLRRLLHVLRDPPPRRGRAGLPDQRRAG